MDVRIGVIHIPKELSVEMPEDTDREDLRARIDEALAGTAPTLWLTDTRGRQIGLPSERIGYVELAADEGDRPVGFG